MVYGIWYSRLHVIIYCICIYGIVDYTTYSYRVPGASATSERDAAGLSRKIRRQLA